MDHNAVAGYLLANEEAANMYGSDGIVSRREAHYKAWYQSWLIDNRRIFPGTIACGCTSFSSAADLGS
jgi:hypothetical protein